ncbi:MAG: cysteinyl-tRNA synthetase, partial [uncultured bacterium]
MKALGVISPTKQPRATSYIAEMQALISVLLEEEIAYRAVSGDIYYDVKKFSSYGKLSHRHLDELQAGIRVEVSEDKKNPLDFVLWK